MDWLNNIQPTIDFIYQLENNNTLLFMDILLINIALSAGAVEYTDCTSAEG